MRACVRVEPCKCAVLERLNSFLPALQAANVRLEEELKCAEDPTALQINVLKADSDESSGGDDDDADADADAPLDGSGAPSADAHETRFVAMVGPAFLFMAGRWRGRLQCTVTLCCQLLAGVPCRMS